MLKIYQTANLDGYLNPSFYDLCSDATEISIDPLYSWYADLFFLNRKKHIILSNELTKFSFLILEYKAREELFFGETFVKYFSFAFHNNGINPAPYLNSFGDFALNFKVNKSILAHISRLKEEYVPQMKIFYDKNTVEKLLVNYNTAFNERPTTYKNTKGYQIPLDFMKEELKKRKLNII